MNISTAVFQARNSNSNQFRIWSRENRPKTLVIFAMIAAIMFWASAFPAISVALTSYTPTEVAFLRYVVASVVLIFYGLIKGMPLPRSRDIPSIRRSLALRDRFIGFYGFYSL